MESILKKAIEKAGGPAALARALNIKSQAISQWDRVPAARVLQVERLSGFSRYDLRPDVFGAAPEGQAAA
jgi:DNA-binding transcriptional regulator YdaS (Cro superfamily)